MKILLTNDDGVNAPGINILFKELSKHHDVLLVAPDREQSATSHSLTLNRPLRLHKLMPNYFSCDGTPTDSVLLGILKILKHKKPDMVISGINHGPNMAEDVMYSGTVAAAIEGSQLGIQSLAVSMVNSVGADFVGGARFVRRLLRLYPQLDITSATILNINLPGKVKDGFKKYQFTYLGSREYDDIILERKDPRGLDYYWIAGSPIWKKELGSDFDAVTNGVVSITPIHFHFTDNDFLDKLISANLRLPR
jgi:5'-nucleotidase